MSESTGEFRFQHGVDVRYRDLDSAGHAHHTMSLIYLEEARAEYWRTVAGRPGVDDIDYVMGEITIRFHQRIHWPARVEVGLRVSRIGTKSFDMEFEVRDGYGELLSSGRTVQVMYDYEAGRAVALDAELRERIERFEAGT